ncbi:hypothetical protein LG3211_4414 [Lysobacter gummosus]|nr:hypothetical protein LG3211_4414 [Lysobacter gummosus]
MGRAGQGHQTHARRPSGPATEAGQTIHVIPYYEPYCEGSGALTLPGCPGPLADARVAV